MSDQLRSHARISSDGKWLDSKEYVRRVRFGFQEGEFLKAAAKGEVQTLVSFTLGFAIPVPDGTYSVSMRGRIVRIDISKIAVLQRVESTVPVEGEPTKLAMNLTGGTAHSQITVILPWAADHAIKTPPSNILGQPPRRQVKQLAIRYVNRLIDVIRFVTGEFHLQRVTYSDVRSYQCNYWDGTQVVLGRDVWNEMWGSNPDSRSSGDELKRIKEVLENEGRLDLAQTFMLNAKDAAYVEDYRKATIEGVMALEAQLSKFIQDERKKPGRGVSGNLDVARQLLEARAEKVDALIVSTCKDAIASRNGIIHRGITEVTQNDTEKRIEAIEALISQLKKCRVMSVLA